MLMKYFVVLNVFVVLFFYGCSNQIQYNKYTFFKSNQHLHNNLNSAIFDISSQLFNSTNKKNLSSKVVVTSSVALENFENTTQLGRLLGESMLSELHKIGFKVLDFRGRDAILVNKDGEFYITRDITKLKDEIDNANILVGTYSLFDQDSILINVRIVNFENGAIISSARVVYTINNCKLLGNCKQTTQIDIIEDK